METATVLSAVHYKLPFFNRNGDVIFGKEEASELRSVILIERGDEVTR